MSLRLRVLVSVFAALGMDAFLIFAPTIVHHLRADPRWSWAMALATVAATGWLGYMVFTALPCEPGAPKD